MTALLTTILGDEKELVKELVKAVVTVAVAVNTPTRIQKAQDLGTTATEGASHGMNTMIRRGTTAATLHKIGRREWLSRLS
jgi:hypothetical protein